MQLFSRSRSNANVWSSHRLAFLTVLVSCFSAGLSSVAAAQFEPPILTKGKKFQSEIDLDESTWKTFRISIPENAIKFDLKLEGSIGDLDLYIKFEEEMLDWSEADFSAEETDFNEELALTRWESEFQPGIYYVDVVHYGDQRPRVDGIRVDAISFGITFDYVVAEEGSELEGGTILEGTVEREEANTSFYYIDVPEDADCLRLDVFDADHALSVYLSERGPVVDVADADFLEDSWARNKTILIDETSDPPLAAGRYYLAVRDFFDMDSNFSLRTAFSAEPPADRLEIPVVEAPDSPLAHAYTSTVMLIMDTGIGSGTVLTPDGLILTNYHVVEDYELGTVPIDQKIIVGVSLDPSKPVAELYLARVVDTDQEHDLAMVEIVSGLYGQELPEDFRFPHTTIAEQPLPDFGDELIMIGYPAIGSSTTGAYVSMTRGIVSGFDRGIEGLMIKTDADIASGNSGGAGMNTDFELIGVPMQSISESDDNGQMGYLVPTTSIPADWIEMIKERLGDE